MLGQLRSQDYLKVLDISTIIDFVRNSAWFCGLIFSSAQTTDDDIEVSNQT